MTVETLTAYIQCILENTCIITILYAINKKSFLGILKTAIYIVILSLWGTALDYFQVQYHLAFSILVMIASYLLVRRPPRISIVSYIIDVAMSIIILSLTQLLITGIAGLFSIDLMENNVAIIIILVCLIFMFAGLSSVIAIRAFLEKYYIPYRITVLFVVISLVILVTIAVNLALYHENVFSGSGNGQVILLIIGFFIINLMFGINLLRMKRVSEKNTSVMEYGEHLQNSVNEYRSLVHDYKHHLQMVVSLNMDKDGNILNKDLNEYIEGLIDNRKRTDSISIIKDDVLISAMLYQKQELAKQRNINFSVNVAGSLTSYAIPNTDLIDILINLIDNAFEEVEILDADARIVHLDMSENTIEIRNRVSLKTSSESKNDTTLFFEQGYSTKASNRGFGLSRVLSIAERNSIKVSSEWKGPFIVFRLDFSAQQG